MTRLECSFKMLDIWYSSGDSLIEKLHNKQFAKRIALKFKAIGLMSHDRIITRDARGIPK